MLGVSLGPLVEMNMTGILDPLLLDLVEWVARQPRPYADVMDAWRTSCPRLTVWEDAVDLGLVQRESRGRDGVYVLATSLGRQLLEANARSVA